MKIRAALFLALLCLPTATLHAQLPQLVNYQGRVAVGTPPVNFDGSGSFKFALVNVDGTTTYWSNDGTSAAGSEPTAAVTLTVTKGLYSVLLGDVALANMSAIPAGVWANADVRLRVWFNDGTNGSQLLLPDSRLAPNGYIADGSVSSAAIASGAVTSTKIAAGAVTNAQLANSGVTLTAGAGLGGGGAVSLGGNVAFTNAGVLSLTGGGGITVDAATGAITLGSTATSANTASAIVARDASGDFSARTITLGGNLALPATSATAGVITVGGVRLLHSFGVQNVFVGGSAGNFTMSGSGNTAIGFEALISNTSGASNVAVGRQALRLNTAGGNTALGTETLYTNTSGDNNTASGYRALHFNTTGGFNTAHGSSALVANTTGSENTAMGHSAMGSNTTGTANTAMGLNALFGNTTGTANTASGYKALRVNSTGYFNTASGTRALEANTTGFENTASGVNALQLNSTGNNNTASGKNALATNTTGNFNTASGSLSLFKNTTGTSNTATGINALYENTTGSSNIAIGSGAGSLLTTGSNNIAIGHTGFAGEGNIIRIGTAQTDTFLAGIIHGNGAGLSVPATTITGSIVSGQLAADLTLGGTTSGSFSGSLSGNATNVTGVVAIANGGTGSAAQNFVDLTTNQTGISGTKAFNGNVGIGTTNPGFKLDVFSATGTAIVGRSTVAGGAGLYGESTLFNGVQGVGNHVDHGAVVGVHNAAGVGVLGQSTGTGVHGNSLGAGPGVFGESAQFNGVRGLAHNAAHGGVVGIHSGAGDGVYATSASGNGVRGDGATGLAGYGTSGYGVFGTSTGSDAGYFAGNVSVTETMEAQNVRGYSQNALAGVYGRNDSPTGWAGYFQGNAHVTGTLSKGGGSFKIDHPLDPANKTLSHSFVESPDMMNIYNGNIALDDQGEAVVVLPRWFDALNKEFRYQLTCVGGFAPVYVAEEIAGNRFKIAGGRRGLKVSWQVTGVRRDAWANSHRIPVEEAKSQDERGFFLHPAEIGYSVEKSVEWARHRAAMRARPAVPTRSAAPTTTP